MTEIYQIKDQIKLLVNIQNIDAKLFDLKLQKKTFPEKIQQMEDDFNSEMKILDELDQEHKKIQVSHKEKEVDMKAKEDLIVKHQTTLYQIKNNKEYKALQQEIDNIKADISVIEEDIINFLDKIEEIESKIKEKKVSFEEKKKILEKEKLLLKEEEKKIEETINSVNKEKKEFEEKIDNELLLMYRKILDNKGKIALVKIEGESCGACNMQLRAQVINEVKIAKKIVYCENCSRILYIDE